MSSVLEHAPRAGPVDGAGPALRLLARLRDIMAGTGDAQACLDKIVRSIAEEFRVEVCSCYVLRPGDVLELFSTLGLNPGAVHQTRLRVGEGLIGLIAASGRPLAFNDAQHHPNFAYRPETDEDPFRSLMGVPIVRGGKVRGVLAVQSNDRRRHDEEAIETLQTVAMIVAELLSTGLAGGHASDTPEHGEFGVGSMLPARIEGVTLNDGLADGVAILHRPELTIRQLVADDPRWEKLRLEQALSTLYSSLDAMLARTAAADIGDSHEILQTYRMFAEDPGWLSRISEAIRTGLTAEAAVQRVQNDMAARFAHVTDPYLRERLMDFDDLANRLLVHLSGRSSLASAGTIPDRTVLVARSMGPAELLDYDRDQLCAIVLEDGSTTSHVAIIAKALDIPIVGRCVDAMSLIEPFDRVIVDGDNAHVFVRPAEDVQAAFRDNMTMRAQRRRAYAELAGVPAVSLDGVHVSLNLNAGLLVDVPHLQDTGADGIGLYRTEVPFMVRASYPNVDEQTALYHRVLDLAGDKPVQFRTLDIGGDKSLPYFTKDKGENPALGWRAIRIGLDRPAMLRQQVRALLRAAAGRQLSVMFPLIADVPEFDEARALLAAEMARAVADGAAPIELRVGVMVEVPALLWQLPTLLTRVDFVAVGSNDLMQYVFAADRCDPSVAYRYDPLSPVAFSVFSHLLQACTTAQVPISVCGEIAARPLEAMALVGLGFRNLSMPPANVGAVKAMIRNLRVAQLADYLRDLQDRPRRSLRLHLEAFARDHGVPV